jgi:hypothetical protein
MIKDANGHSKFRQTRERIRKIEEKRAANLRKNPVSLSELAAAEKAKFLRYAAMWKGLGVPGEALDEKLLEERNP